MPLIRVEGKDGVRLWKMDGMKELATPPKKATVIGPPTKLKWFHAPNEGELTLFIGTATGFLLLWQQNDVGVFETTVSQRVSEQEILDVAIDNVSDVVRIAIGTHCGTVQLWNYKTDGALTPEYSVRMEGSIPRGVAFATRSRMESIIVFGFKDGLV